jgi:hypothetical protein
MLGCSMLVSAAECPLHVVKQLHADSCILGGCIGKGSPEVGAAVGLQCTSTCPSGREGVHGLSRYLQQGCGGLGFCLHDWL